MPDNADFRRRRLLAGALLVLPLGACGFRPLYGTGGATSGETADDVAAELARVHVIRIPERSGQVLRTNLLRVLDPSGIGGDNAYDLLVTLTITERSLGIRNDDAAEQANLVVTATYNLSDSGGAPLATGTVSRFTGYAILDDEYATRTTAATAEVRALEAIAEDLRTRLALYFSRPPSIA